MRTSMARREPVRRTVNQRQVQRATCTDGDHRKALCDPLGSRVVGVEVVREITCIGRSEQNKPAYQDLVEMVVPVGSAASRQSTHALRVARMVRLCAGSPRSFDTHHVSVGLGNSGPGWSSLKGATPFNKKTNPIGVI